MLLNKYIRISGATQSDAIIIIVHDMDFNLKYS